MKTYRVETVDTASREERAFEVQAQSQEAARILAEQGTVRVARIVPVKAGATSTGATGSLIETCRTTLLVAAIGGIVVGIVWFMTYAGIVVAVPMWILAYYQLRERRLLLEQPVSDERSRALYRLGVWTLISGLFNAVGLVCGILLLVNQGSLMRRP